MQPTKDTAPDLRHSNSLCLTCTSGSLSITSLIGSGEGSSYKQEEFESKSEVRLLSTVPRGTHLTDDLCASWTQQQAALTCFFLPVGSNT